MDIVKAAKSRPHRWNRVVQWDPMEFNLKLISQLNRDERNLYDLAFSLLIYRLGINQKEAIQSIIIILHFSYQK